MKGGRFGISRKFPRNAPSPSPCQRHCWQRYNSVAFLQLNSVQASWTKMNGNPGAEGVMRRPSPFKTIDALKSKLLEVNRIYRLSLLHKTFRSQ